MGDHDLGLRLRQALLQERARAQPLDGRRLQALVGDLCQGEQQALLPPLRHLVLSPVLLGEAARTPPLAEPRSRSRFQQELRGVFAPPLCDRMEAVIDGLLDLPPASPALIEPAPRRSAPIAAAEPLPVPPAAPTPVDAAFPPVSTRQDSAPRLASSGGRNLWPLVLVGSLGGCLLAVVAVLLQVSRSPGPETATLPPVGSAAPAASGPAVDTAAGSQLPAGADQPADAPVTMPATTALPPSLTNPSSPSSTAPSLLPVDPAVARPDDGVVTPSAPELPQAPGAAGLAAGGAEASTAAAIRTVEALYGALGRHDAAAARGYFAGEAADQFDPAFFRQFARVEVSALQPTTIAPTTVSLDGVVTFVYPDGSRQTERRSFTLDTRADPPRVIASAFGAVLRPRGPAR